MRAAGSGSGAKGAGDAGGSVTDLEARLREVMARGVAEPLPEEEINALALEIFRHQARENRVYGAFVRGRGIEPGELSHWREIPLVPSRAFKELPLICGDLREAEAVFRTSETTRGGDARGTHHVRSLSLYRASLAPNASAYLHPELDGSAPGVGASTPLRVLSLVPSPDDRPDSSLVHMLGVLAGKWDDGGGGFFADGPGARESPRGRVDDRAGHSTHCIPSQLHQPMRALQTQNPGKGASPQSS